MPPTRPTVRQLPDDMSNKATTWRATKDSFLTEMRGRADKTDLNAVVRYALEHRGRRGAVPRTSAAHGRHRSASLRRGDGVVHATRPCLVGLTRVTAASVCAAHGRHWSASSRQVTCLRLLGQFA